MILAVRTLPNREALKFPGGNPLIFADWLEKWGHAEDAGHMRQARGHPAPAHA